MLRSRGSLLVVLLLSRAALAHFILQAPLAEFDQGILGDPQKAPPCGSDNSAVSTNKVTTFEAGQTITITVNETIYHPGHYRVALGLTGPQDLPAEPTVTAGASACGSVPIDAMPAFPVLADGQLLHTASFGGPKSFQVTIPSNITCTNCTLQVLEFMSSHPLNVPGGCFYHHCATINVVAPSADGGSPDGGTTPGPTGGCSCSGGGSVLLCALAALLLTRRGAAA